MLDLCLTDNLEIIKNIEITTRLGNSDHLSIEAELIFPKKVSKSYAEKRNYYKGDYMSANVKLSNINWSCMNEMDIETSWQYFANQVSDIINETIPVHK